MCVIYIYMNIFIYLYIYIKEKEGLSLWLADGPCSFLLWLKESTYSRHGLNLGVEGKSSLTRNSRTIKHWRNILNTRKEQEMVFDGINQGERFVFAVHCMLKCQHVILCCLNFLQGVHVGRHGRPEVHSQ